MTGRVTVVPADGTDVRAYDQGRGPTVVLLGPGLDDGTRCARLAEALAGRFRVIRPHRRQYRLDPSPPGLTKIREEHWNGR